MSLEIILFYYNIRCNIRYNIYCKELYNIFYKYEISPKSRITLYMTINYQLLFQQHFFFKMLYDYHKDDSI